MFIVSKALLMSIATVIVHAGKAIWLKPFATVLFSVCSAVIVECCVLYRVTWVCLVCLLLCKEEGACCIFAITERSDMGLYEEPFSMSLLGFGLGNMRDNFHMFGIMLSLKVD